MSFHLLSWSLATGGSIVDTAVTPVPDPEIAVNGNNFVFTEPFEMWASALFGATITRANYSLPQWNQYTKFNIWPPNRSLGIPSPPQLDTWFDYPVPFSQNENFSLLVTDTTSEQATAFTWIAPRGQIRNLPSGQDPVPIIETRWTLSSASITQNVWSTLQTPVLEQNLRAGTYAIVGSQVQGTNLLAYRWVFPRAPIWQGRKLRPGGLATNAIGDLMEYNLPRRQFTWGEWGRFSTFELPKLEFFINTTGSPTIEGRLWLVHIKDSTDVTY